MLFLRLILVYAMYEMGQWIRHTYVRLNPPTLMPSTITTYNDEAINTFQIRLDDKAMAKIGLPSNAIITGLKAPELSITNKERGIWIYIR